MPKVKSPVLASVTGSGAAPSVCLEKMSAPSCAFALSWLRAWWPRPATKAEPLKTVRIVSLHARSERSSRGTYRMTAPSSREAARSGQDGFPAWWEREDDCGVAIVGCGDEENGFGGEEHADRANREGRR